MDETTFRIVKTIAVVLAFAGTSLVQWRAPLVKERGRVSRNWRTNAPFAAANAVLVGLICGACVGAFARHLEIDGRGLTTKLGLSLPARILVSVGVLDLTAYLWHRANHLVPFLWRFHAVHHTDPVYDASTALRFHPGEVAISLGVRLAVVGIFGLPVVGILAFEALYALANTFEHGNIRLADGFSRRLGRVLVTPAIHRLHHAPERARTNSNYATIFSGWDRLFGTFVPPGPATTAAAVGLPPSALDPFDPVVLMALPFRKAPG